MLQLQFNIHFFQFVGVYIFQVFDEYNEIMQDCCKVLSYKLLSEEVNFTENKFYAKLLHSALLKNNA